MLTKTHEAAIAAAGSPEEAAQIFKHAVTVGLADVVAKALSDALKTQKAKLVAGAKNAAWPTFVAGACMQMDWDRTNPLSTLPMIHVSSFAPMTETSTKAFGVDVSVGISIGGHF